MRSCTKVLALVGALATSAGPAWAGPQPPAATFDWVEVQGVQVGNPGTAGLKSVWGAGLAAGQWLTPHWGWEASLVRNPVEVPSAKWQSLEAHAHASFLWDPLPNPAFWRPFLRVGAGVSGGVYEPPLAAPGTSPGLGLTPTQLTTPNTPSTTSRLSLLAGAGLQILIGPHGLATLEARAVNIQVTPASGRTETQALLGVGYLWGQPAPSHVTPGINPTVTPLPAPRPSLPEPLPSHPQQPAAASDEPTRPPESEITSSDLPLPRKIVLDETVLHFTNGGDRLSPEGERAVREVALRLRRYAGNYRLEVVGHTSSTGTRTSNQRLSLRRAQAVARVLEASGIDARRIRCAGAGQDQPVASNRTAIGQSRNRRVEILIQTRDPEVERQRTSTPLAGGRPRQRRGPARPPSRQPSRKPSRKPRASIRILEGLGPRKW